MRRLIMFTIYSGAYISCSYNGPIDFKKNASKTIEKAKEKNDISIKLERQSFRDVFKKSSDLAL